MSREESNPPRAALWLLLHACPGSHKQALTGDLVEKFHEGQSRGWLWKQVLMAIAVGVLGEVRRHWPHFSYAIAGTAMPFFLGKAAVGVRGVVHWYAMPWPWSQLVFEWSPEALLALTALPILAAALAIERALRTVSILRTALLSLALIALVHYLPDAFPWLLRPMPGNPHFKVFLIPYGLRVLFFFAFFVSAWLGCPPAPRGILPSCRPSAPSPSGWC